MQDPDLRDKGGGGGGGRSSGPLDKAGGRSPKKIFSALRASVWTKNKGGGGGAPPGPSPGSGTGYIYEINKITFVFQSIFADKERK